MRSALFLVLALSAHAAWAQFMPLVPSETGYSTLIVNTNDPGLYQLFYKRVGIDEIQFEAHCRNLGWCGFGISPQGTMSGSDIAKFWVKDGLVFMFDAHAIGNIPPRVDTVHNLQLLGGAEVGAYTIAKWKRKLITGDSQHDIDIVNSPQFLLFAWNPQDPVTGEGDWLYHGTNRYVKQENLLNSRSG